MSRLADIAVQVETTAPTQPEDQSTGNVLPLLHELAHALDRLLTTQEPTTLDLRSLPMAPADDDALRQALGVGEIKIELDSLGRSDIWETRFPAVWWIEHFNADNDLMGRYLEVNWVPAIVQAQTDDVRDGLAQLRRQLVS